MQCGHTVFTNSNLSNKNVLRTANGEKQDFNYQYYSTFRTAANKPKTFFYSGVLQNTTNRGPLIPSTPSTLGLLFQQVELHGSKLAF